MDPRGSRTRRGHAAFDWRPVRRWPRRACGVCPSRSRTASTSPARRPRAACVSYRDLNGTATHDSWLVEQLRAAGAVIVGKTHLHPLAYGITGENPEFGDCVQPRDSGALTGGSSSGAVASVQEGSAVAAIGTDTGGSVRAPAALGGLAGYRAPPSAAATGAAARTWPSPSTPWVGSSATLKMRRC